MQHIQGISRHQLQVVPLEDIISQDNPVRFIDFIWVPTFKSYSNHNNFPKQKSLNLYLRTTK